VSGSDSSVHRRDRKPTGRQTAQKDVLKVTLELLPDEVKR
jgi:hypothetical protein